MPEILLVAATQGEVMPIISSQAFHQQTERYFEAENGQIGLLITGIGMVNTAWALGQFLATNKVRLGVNVGIAGSFDRAISLGEVVEVKEDIFSELGAQSPQGFLDLEKMGFPLFQKQSKTVYNTLSNRATWGGGLKEVRAITVNTVHGLSEPIASVQERLSPHIETMEGAAFFLAFQKADIPAYAFRSISNYVEVRNREKWNIPLAIRELSTFVNERLLPSLLD